jgi:hypothetical protein
MSVLGGMTQNWQKYKYQNNSTKLIVNGILIWVLTYLLRKFFRLWFSVWKDILCHAVCAVRFVAFCDGEYWILSLSYREVVEKCSKSFRTYITSNAYFIYFCIEHIHSVFKNCGAASPPCFIWISCYWRRAMLEMSSASCSMARYYVLFAQLCWGTSLGV